MPSKGACQVSGSWFLQWLKQTHDNSFWMSRLQARRRESGAGIVSRPGGSPLERTPIPRPPGDRVSLGKMLPVLGEKMPNGRKSPSCWNHRFNPPCTYNPLFPLQHTHSTYVHKTYITHVPLFHPCQVLLGDALFKCPSQWICSINLFSPLVPSCLLGERTLKPSLTTVARRLFRHSPAIISGGFSFHPLAGRHQRTL